MAESQVVPTAVISMDVGMADAFEGMVYVQYFSLSDLVVNSYLLPGLSLCHTNPYVEFIYPEYPVIV